MLSKQIYQVSSTGMPTSTPLQNMEPGKYCERGRWTSINILGEVLRNFLPRTLVLRENSMLVQHMRFKTGERIHTVGQPFDTVYVVYSGFVRVSSCDDLGNEQVLSFPMRGDLFGLDGIHSGHYVSEAIALTECNLILLPFYKFNEIFQAQPEFEQAIFRAMSHELVREQMMIGVLGTLGADARVARFLMLNSERFRQLGWSEKSFNLSMTRRDIGSYLGLSLETVSRILSSFDEAGLIRVENRTITILNPQLLKSMSSVGSRKKRGASAQDSKPERDLDGAFPAVAVMAENARKRPDRIDLST